MESFLLVEALFALGWAGLVLLAFSEKFIPVLPSYVLLTFLGMTLVGTPGQLAIAILATVLGSTLGALAWYGVGRTVGDARCERLVARYGRYVFLSTDLYRRLAAAYHRNHFWVTLVGQTVPTARIYLALPAGVIGLSWPPFLVATAIGSFLWNGPLLTLGYALRGTGKDPLGLGLKMVALVLVVEGVCLLVYRSMRTRRP